MADFGCFSDTDDSAVEELLSQAKDLSVLEQIASINCSGFTDSTLPDDLESRFRRLKSLPATATNPAVSAKKHLGRSTTGSGRKSGSGQFSGEEKGIFSGKRNPVEKVVSSSDEETRVFSGNKRNPDDRTGTKKNSRSGSASDSKKKSSGKCIKEIGEYNFENSSDSGKVCSNSSNSSDETDFSPADRFRSKKKVLNQKSRRKNWPGSSSSSSVEALSQSDSIPEEKKKPNPKSKPNSSNSWLDLLSPARTIGCLWRSPKKESRKRTIESKFLGSESKKNLDFDEFLADLSEFSVEEQRKILKKAMEEQEKMRREAAKVVKMARQASARIGYDD